MFALLIAAALPPYPGFEPLKASGNSAMLCTSDSSICVGSGEEGEIKVTRDGKEVADWSEETEGDSLSFAPMPALLRLKDGRLLVGVLAQNQTSYSGGGGNATELRLFLVAPGGATQPVLEVPDGGSLMIRACFDEKDAKHRAGACHDEYRFDGRLSVAAANASGLPMLGFAMTASHFPRGVSRDGDSLASPPLRKADLVWQTDPRCTYRRSFHFDAAAKRYVPDTPLPDCNDYTQP